MQYKKLTAFLIGLGALVGTVVYALPTTIIQTQNLKLNKALIDVASSTGSSGQVLSSTGTSTLWVAQSGGGGSGIVATGTTNQVAYYSATGTALAGNNSLLFDPNTGITYINSLQTGPLNLPPDAGIVSWTNMRFTSTTLPAEVVNSYTAHLNDQPVLTIYGESNGSGGVKNLRVGILTTTPVSALHIGATGTLSFGNVPATTGVIRLENNTGIYARRADNASDLNLISTNGSNQTLVGNSTGATLFTSDVGFGTDNIFDIGGGTRSPRHIFARSSLVVGTSTLQGGSTGLTIQGSGAGNPFTILTSTALASSMFTVSTNGNIGINSSTPQATLALQGISGQPIFKVVSSSNGISPLEINANGDVNIRSAGGSHTFGFTESTGLVFTSSFNKVFFGGTNPYLRALSNTGVGLHGNWATSQAGVSVFFSDDNNRQPTSGTSTMVQVRGQFLPLSGTGDFAGLDVTPTVSTSPSYNGKFISVLRVSPLITAASATFPFLFDVGTNSAAQGAGVHTPLFVIDKNGRVGINTSSPNATLAVQTASSINPFLISSSTGGDIFQVTLEGYVRGRYVETGSITTFSVTSTITAEQLCNSTMIRSNPITTANVITLTLPSSSTLFTTCLKNIGDKINLLLFGYVVNTSTQFNAGAGGQFIASPPQSSLIIGDSVGEGGANVNIIRTSTNGYEIYASFVRGG